MKHAFLFFLGLALSIFAFAQSDSFGNEEHIKITAGKDTLRLSFRDKTFTLHNTSDLDSCLGKNIPETLHPDVDLETTDMTPEEHRAIIVIMDKYRFPVVTERAVSSGKGKFAISVRGATYQ